MTTIPPKFLTKTLFQKALTCPRKIAYTNQKCAQQPISSFLRNLADDGHCINRYSRLFYPHGIPVQRDTYRAVEETRQLLLESHAKKSSVTLLEAAFLHQNCLIRADIVHQRDDGSLELIEVKAKAFDSTHPKMVSSASGKIKADYLMYVRDVAFQYYVMQRALNGQNKVTPYLLLLDKSKVNTVSNLYELVMSDDDPEHRQVIQDSESLLTKVNVQELVDGILNDPVSVPGNEFATFEDCIQHFCTMVQLPEEDQVQATSPAPIGAVCKDCEFRVQGSGFDQCWSEHGIASPATSHLVVDLYHGGRLTNKLIKNQSYTFEDVTASDLGVNENRRDTKPKKKPGLSRKERQYLQVSQAGPVVFESNVFQSHLDDWRWPFHFVDFETIAPALPYTVGKRPYEALAFQFSHHILTQDGTVTHANEFLCIEPGICPNVRFLDHLVESLQDESGTVFRWGSFENTILKSVLASIQSTEEIYPNRSFVESLIEGGDREMVDLMSIVNQTYYVHGSGGSSSIKSLLLPTMTESKVLKEIYGKPTYNSKNFKNMQWWQLEAGSDRLIDPYKLFQNDNDATSVSHGGDAIVAYKSLVGNECDAEQRMQIESSLLKYCELDTLAMVMIMQGLLGLQKEGRF